MTTLPREPVHQTMLLRRSIFLLVAAAVAATWIAEARASYCLYVGKNLTVLGANRFDLKYGMGGLPHETLMRNIELYGTQVIPRVRELLPESIEPTPQAAVS